MSYFKLFVLMVVLQSVYCQSGQGAVTDEDHVKAPTDFIKLLEILPKLEQEMDKMKQNQDEQKSEHEKQIHELRQIIAKQDRQMKVQNGRIKELMTYITESEVTTTQKKFPNKDRETSDIKPANVTIEELEQRVKI